MRLEKELGDGLELLTLPQRPSGGRRPGRTRSDPTVIGHAAWSADGPQSAPKPLDLGVVVPIWDIDGRTAPSPENAESPETHCFRAFHRVAGAGFEPATFGL
jgi:hypothetical protein